MEICIIYQLRKTQAKEILNVDAVKVDVNQDIVNVLEPGRYVWIVGVWIVGIGVRVRVGLGEQIEKGGYTIGGLFLRGVNVRSLVV